MWARLDDELIDHHKVFAAGKRLGTKDGPAIALGMFAVSLMWSNKHLTDGFLPTSTVEGFRHVDKPLAVADALAQAGLFDRVEGGFEIHDFAEYNPSARAIKAKRKEDRVRKQRERAKGNGHA
jgi:hypothetical protein